MSRYTFWQMIERLEQIAGMKGYLADHDKEIITDAISLLRKQHTASSADDGWYCPQCGIQNGHEPGCQLDYGTTETVSEVQK